MIIKGTKRRIVTKIGDVFCAEVDGEFKAYFQYVANDLTQLNSSVIRVFEKHYPMDYEPVIEEIVKDDVQFYAHTILRSGIELNSWYKIGKSMNIGEAALENVIFGSAYNIEYNIHTHEIKDVDTLNNWYIWKIGQKMRHIGKLPKKYQNDIYIGSVLNCMSILSCIKFGFFLGYYDLYSVLRRHPRPDADIYMTDNTDNKSFHYHFRGENTVREVIKSSERITKLTQDKPNKDGEKIRTEVFSNTHWRKENFISRDEFEEVWNA